MLNDAIKLHSKIYELNYSDIISGCLNKTIVSLYSYTVNKVELIEDVEELRVTLTSCQMDCKTSHP